MSNVMNVVTDAVLAVECGIFWARLRRLGAAGEAWSAFFGPMTVAIAAGGVRHAVPDGTPARIAALLVLDVALGLSVLAAQRASLLWRTGGRRDRLVALFHVQLGAFWVVALLRHDFLPAFVNTLIGLGWVLATAIPAVGSGERGTASVVGGLLIGAAAGIVYALGRGPAAWFDHVDVAHIVMMGSLLLLHRGAMTRAVAS